MMKKMIAWVEIPALDIRRAVKFYNTILKTDLEILDFGSEKMACFPTGEGAISEAPGFTPSKNGALVSFDTGDALEETIAAITVAGGEIVTPKTKIEAEGRGYFAIFTDTEGNRVGLYGNR
jgi:uncharacterized protein